LVTLPFGIGLELDVGLVTLSFFLSSLVSSLRLHYLIGKQYNWFIFKRVPESLPRVNMSRGRS
jgi:hypothetical protein